MPQGLVSVCIPTLGRPASLARCLSAIAANTQDWPHEVIVRHDQFGHDRKGCPRMLAECVAESRGQYVAFIGNDTIPQLGWLRLAMECMARSFQDGAGMVGFGDSFWKDGRSLHWVASKALLPMLDGEFFCTQYAHVGVDDELMAKCAQTGKYIHCPEAMVEHQHLTTGAAMDPVYELAWRTESVERDRALLRERAARMGFAAFLRS